ncbi:helix-turn-helix domain-containing protein [Streptomyces jumonjinensis]|uniref:Helix-turn-helix domain-containing protein n=1 Tax=Streptomyces jumonjinensis TaxID=1945 RepID=A0A646KRQ2_STRJU|nr:helix-turn-helix transcriptional regulator [Streptomyces jumonjinensis]MQT04780.1 helix-turn-helix domain-containing protein [Streptomyces jumonjinensis]
MTDANRPGRRKKELAHDGGPVTALALALRELRVQAGNPPYRTMAERANVSQNVLSQADAGHRLPTEEALAGYVTACGGDVQEWSERLRRARLAQSALQGTELSADSLVGRESQEPRPNNEAPVQGASPEAGAAWLRDVQPERRAIRQQSSSRRRSVFITVASIVVIVALAAAWHLTSPDSSEGRPPRAKPDPTSTSHSEAEPAASPRMQCRASWESMSSASLYFLPCIERRPDGLAISAQVKAMTPDGVPGGATVWIWLMNIDSEHLNNKRFDLTRSESTLQSCRIDLTDADQIETCGPFTIQPPVQKGLYATSGSARLQGSAHPPGWDSTGFAGTQSPSVPWKG